MIIIKKNNMEFLKVYLSYSSFYSSVSLYTMYVIGYVQYSLIIVYVYAHAAITLIMECAYKIFLIAIKYACHNIMSFYVYMHSNLVYYLDFTYYNIVICLRNMVRLISKMQISISDISVLIENTFTLNVMGPIILTGLILLAILGTAFLGLGLARHCLAPIQVHRGSRRGENKKMVLVFGERGNQIIRVSRQRVSNSPSKRFIYDSNDTTGLFLEMVDMLRTAAMYENVGIEWLVVNNILHKCLVYDDYARAARQPIMVNTWMLFYYQRRFGVVTPKIADGRFDYHPVKRMAPLPSLRSPSVSGIAVYPDLRTNNLLRNRRHFDSIGRIDRYLGR